MSAASSSSPAQPITPPKPARTPFEQMSAREKLEEIKAWLEDGLITEAEAVDAKRAVLGLPPICPESAPVHSGDSGQSEGLKEYFRNAELRAQQPWRVNYERFLNMKADWEEMGIETLREIFMANAKNRYLQPTEAMLSVYLLYGSEEDLDFLRRMMVNSRGHLRMEMHNFYVAHKREDIFLTMHGGKIVDLTEPLLPPTNEFAALNNYLLQDHGTSGGGEGRAMYKPAEEVDPLGGAAQFYVQTDQNGQQFVDLGGVEQAVDNLQRQILSVKGRNGGSKPWWGKYKKNNTQNTPYQQNQYHQNQNQYQHQQQNYNNSANNTNVNNNRGGNPTGAGDPRQPPSSQPPTTSRRATTPP